jgi:hypothetical protein
LKFLEIIPNENQEWARQQLSGSSLSEKEREILTRLLSDGTLTRTWKKLSSAKSTPYIPFDRILHHLLVLILSNWDLKKVPEVRLDLPKRKRRYYDLCSASDKLHRMFERSEYLFKENLECEISADPKILSPALTPAFYIEGRQILEGLSLLFRNKYLLTGIELYRNKGFYKRAFSKRHPYVNLAVVIVIFFKLYFRRPFYGLTAEIINRVYEPDTTDVENVKDLFKSKRQRKKGRKQKTKRGKTPLNR